MTDDRRDPPGAVPALAVQAPARAEHVGALRRAIKGYVESAGGDATTANDLELVVSELATNVIHHTTSDMISITIERTPQDWCIEVADVADGFVLFAEPMLPPTFEHTGRGLFLVRSLVDTIEIVETSTSRVVRCRRSVRSSLGGRGTDA